MARSHPGRARPRPLRAAGDDRRHREGARLRMGETAVAADASAAAVKSEVAPALVCSLCAALSLAGVPFAFGGGAIALGYAAEPRATFDIDVDVFIEPAEATGALDALRALGATVTPLEVQAIEHEFQARVPWGDTIVDLSSRSIRSTRNVPAGSGRCRSRGARSPSCRRRTSPSSRSSSAGRRTGSTSRRSSGHSRNASTLPTRCAGWTQSSARATPPWSACEASETIAGG